MSKLKREAVGQYNYVAPTPMPEKGGRKRHSYPDFYPHTDVTIEIIDPNDFAFSNLKPPKMFDTSYFSDYRHPPAENFLAFKTSDRGKDKKPYTAYIQTSQTQHKGEKQPIKAPSRKLYRDENKIDRSAIKSAGQAARPTRKLSKQEKPTDVATRVRSAELQHAPTKMDKVNEEFYRSLLKARKGSEWNRKPDISYDVHNPEKPSTERKTKPYGSQMENEQELIAHRKGEKFRTQRPSTVGGGSTNLEAESPLPVTIASLPRVKRIGPSGQAESPSISRASTASGRSSARHFQQYDAPDFPRRPLSSSTVSTVGDDYLLETGRHLNETLETIQEEEILEDLHPPSPTRSPKPRIQNEKQRRKPKLKKLLPSTDLFTKKGPDPRFYASKKNLRTPNEMERFRKARNRAFMRNVEQAIPELDLRDHEVKYQPERQLFQDARWRMRQDIKDVRDKNSHSLVDRFEKRQQIVKDETRTRLGDPTYIGRNPVSIYKMKERNDNAGAHPSIGFKVDYPLHNRRRVTPSLGSVQRARNLGSHAQIFNQAIAPPHWGPQKVDHSLFLPAMAQGL